MWCVKKLDDGIHINLNQIRTFEIITLNRIPNNHHDLGEINWAIPGVSEIFLKKINALPDKNNQCYKIYNT